MPHFCSEERHFVTQIDRSERDVYFPDPDEADRAAWAAAAMWAAGPDFWPCADRLALLNICNPRALDLPAPAPGGTIRTILLTWLSRCRRLLARYDGESSGESSFAAGHPDR